MTIATVGIDLAKNVFAVHAVGKSGLLELKRPEVRRAKLLELIASWPPCLIGMETCSGAHYWAREFERLGHTVRLMAPKFVAPYRMAGTRGKNDANDAQAICEAVTRPNMRFVPVKTIDQQAHMVAFVNQALRRWVMTDRSGDATRALQATMNQTHIRGLVTSTSSIRRGPASL